MSSLFHPTMGGLWIPNLAGSIPPFWQDRYPSSVDKNTLNPFFFICQDKQPVVSFLPHLFHDFAQLFSVSLSFNSLEFPPCVTVNSPCFSTFPWNSFLPWFSPCLTTVSWISQHFFGHVSPWLHGAPNGALGEVRPLRSCCATCSRSRPPPAPARRCGAMDGWCRGNAWHRGTGDVTLWLFV